MNFACNLRKVWLGSEDLRNPEVICITAEYYVCRYLYKARKYCSHTLIGRNKSIIIIVAVVVTAAAGDTS